MLDPPLIFFPIGAFFVVSIAAGGSYGKGVAPGRYICQYSVQGHSFHTTKNSFSGSKDMSSKRKHPTRSWMVPLASSSRCWNRRQKRQQKKTPKE